MEADERRRHFQISRGLIAITDRGEEHWLLPRLHPYSFSRFFLRSSSSSSSPAARTGKGKKWMIRPAGKNGGRSVLGPDSSSTLFSISSSSLSATLCCCVDRFRCRSDPWSRHLLLFLLSTTASYSTSSSSPLWREWGGFWCGACASKLSDLRR